MALGPDDLVLCAGTLARVPLWERIPVVARAGFRGLSLFLDDLDRSRADGHSDADLRARLDEHGLAVAELDPVASWAPGVEAGGPGFLRWTEDDFYDAAEAVGARSLNAVCFGTTIAGVPEAFAGLCQRASGRGLLVHLEFMPFTPVKDLATALAVLEEAGHPEAGIMFDVWHHARSGGTREGVAKAAHRVLAVQLDDAPAEAEANLMQETLHRRLLPGEGDAGVAELLRVLYEGGCRAPLGVEVFCDALAELAPDPIAARVAEATRQVLREARGQA